MAKNLSAKQLTRESSHFGTCFKKVLESIPAQWRSRVTENNSIPNKDYASQNPRMQNEIQTKGEIGGLDNSGKS